MFPLRLLVLANRGRKNTAAAAKLKNAWRKSLLYPPLSQLQLSSSYSSSHKPNVESTSKPNNKSSSFLSSKDVKAAFNSTLDLFLKPKDTWKMIKETAIHYWVGTKLLWNEIKLTRQILGKVLSGKSMTRRERIQLVRTSTDLFRLVPFSIFVIVPFMELLLPFALRLFPNMLPSTFQDSLKKEESLKQELQMRLAVANFMQEALEEMARKKSSADDSSVAKEVIEFIERARLGEPIPNESVLQIARLFKDELTLSNISRPQLVSMCQYMQLPPYGADSFLRFQLRNKLRMIKDDDKRILWEGIDSLNDAELREACCDRGMRSMDVPHDRLKTQLKEWLDLTKQQVPTSLLIMSRAFMLTANDPRSSHHLQGIIESTPQQMLQSMAALDSDIINEVVLNSASKSEVDTPDMRRRLLESIQFQKDMIDEERQEQEDATASSAAAAAKTSSSSSSKASIALNASEQSAIDTAVGGAAAVGGAVDASNDAVATAHEKEPTKASSSAISVPIPVDTDITPVGGVSVDGKPREKQELTINELIALGDLARGSALKREISELAVLEAYLEALPDTAGREAILSLKKKNKKNNKDSMGRSAGVSAGVSAEGVHPVVSSSTDTSVIEPKSKSSEGRSLADDSKLVDADTVDEAQEDEDDEIVTAPVVEDRSVARMKSAISLMVNKLKVKINMTEKVLGDKLKLLDKDGDGEITVDEIKGVIDKVIKKGSNKEENIEQLFLLLDSDKDGKVSVVELLQYIQKKRESLEVEAVQAHMQSAQSGGGGGGGNNNNNSSSPSL